MRVDTTGRTFSQRSGARAREFGDRRTFSNHLPHADASERGAACSGSCRTWGKIEEAVGLAEKYNLYKPLVEQSQYSLLCRQRLEKEILPNLSRSGMGLVVFSPLASGPAYGKV